MLCACGFQSSVTKEIIEHLKEKHNYSENKISKIIGTALMLPSIECGICQKRCPSPRHFFIHLLDVHEADPIQAFDDVALAIQNNIAD